MALLAPGEVLARSMRAGIEGKKPRGREKKSGTRKQERRKSGALREECVTDRYRK